MSTNVKPSNLAECAVSADGVATESTTGSEVNSASKFDVSAAPYRHIHTHTHTHGIEAIHKDGHPGNASGGEQNRKRREGACGSMMESV